MKRKLKSKASTRKGESNEGEEEWVEPNKARYQYTEKHHLEWQYSKIKKRDLKLASIYIMYISMYTISQDHACSKVFTCSL